MKMRFQNLLMLALMAIITASFASALEIISPENIEYPINEIPLEITSNETFDNLSQILNNTEILLCENCSSYNDTLNLVGGNYTLTVIGKIDNQTRSENVSFSVVQPETPFKFNIEIVNPLNIIYNSTNIDVIVMTNKTVDLINLSVDNQSFEVLCENCSFHNTSIVLEEGNHSIKVRAQLDNVTREVETDFIIKLPENETPIEFSLDLISPINIVYNNSDIVISVVANRTIDMINFSIDNQSFNVLCENCSSHNTSIILGEGNHSIIVRGQLGNATKEIERDFTIDLSVNETDDDINETDNDTNQTDDDEPRFDIGFNKLPQAVANGQLTDSELADIIRNNQLNPGIINRLIKTGLLEEESINAILDTQFTPQGILKKILAFFGFESPSQADLIYKNYHLSFKIKQNLVARDDLSDDNTDEIKEDLKQILEFRIKTDENGDVQKVQTKIENEKGSSKRQETITIGQKNGRVFTEYKNKFIAGKQNGKDKKIEKSKGNKNKGKNKIEKNNNDDDGKGKNNGKNENRIENDDKKQGKNDKENKEKSEKSKSKEKKKKIKVEIEDDEAEVEIEIGDNEHEFELSTSDIDEIIDEISDRTGLSHDEINEIIKIKYDD